MSLLLGLGSRKKSLTRRDSDNAAKWLAIGENGQAPVGAVDVGVVAGSMAYVGRATMPNGDVVPGTIIPSKAVCLVAYEGKEVECDKYEFLANTQPTLFQVQWLSPSFDGSMPKGAYKGGSTSSGETIYVARARPPNVDSKTSTVMYVARVRNGELQAAMACTGKVHAVTDFKVLCVTEIK